MVVHGAARGALLDAGVDVIRSRGLAGSSVDDICRAAQVTKGAFFHHFASKDDFAVAVARHWAETTAELFAHAEYHHAVDPLDRVLGYIDLRERLLDGTPEEYSCAVGTMTQESYSTNVAVRDACAAAIFDHAATLEADLEAAIERADAPGDVTAAGLARFTQAVLQGSFILGKASDDSSLARENVHYLRESFRRFLQSSQPTNDRRRAAAQEDS